MSIVALLSLPLASTPAGGASVGRRIGRESFCVTTGEIRAVSGNRVGIDSPKVRAVVREATPQSAEMRFKYLGPSAGSAPLASGTMRRQIGLKLRAQDGCNLVYAMWIEFGVGGPEAGPVSLVPASIRDKCGEDKGGD